MNRIIEALLMYIKKRKDIEGKGIGEKNMSIRQTVDSELKDILADYQTCNFARSCGDCKASMRIPTYTASFCSFLVEHRDKVYEEITSTLEKVL